MKRFEFTVYEKKEGGPAHTFFPTLVVKEGATFVEALAALTESHPHHHVAEHLRGLWREVETTAQ